MACDARAGIGHKDAPIPWDCPEDRAFFRGIIGSSALIMGHKTYATFSPSFKCGRKIFLFSKTLLELPDTVPTVLVNSWTHFERLCLPSPTFMIGGSEIASLFFEKQALWYFILSHIHGGPYASDRFLHTLPLHTWSCHTLYTSYGFTVKSYKNPLPSFQNRFL